MPTIETTGKSVQEATQAAAQKLGAAPDQLVVTILEEHKGLFGKATVRIRAEVSGAEAEASPAPAAAPAPEAPAAEAKPKGRGRQKPQQEPKAEKELAPETAAVAEVEAASLNGEETEEAPRAAVEATTQDADRLLNLVEKTLEVGSLDVTAKVTGTSGRYVNIEIDGRDVAFLVGKHGEVLNALQYVVNIIANQQYGNGVRVTLDGNNYRHRREEALTKLATKIADQVRQRGEEAVLDALPAFERRIVHKALAEYEGVTTYSEGEEPNRRVVIAPAD